MSDRDWLHLLKAVAIFGIFACMAYAVWKGGAK